MRDKTLAFSSELAMTQQLLTCPYCNAQFPRPSLAPETTRVTCPRCDETFPRHASALDEAISAQPLALPAPVSQLTTEENTAQRLPAHWIVQVFVLSVMVGVGSLALKLAFPDSNTTQRALPFMLVMACVGMVASLWLWFFQTSRSNGVIAAFVLGNMVGVALLVLPFALEWTSFRRGNDPKKPPDEPAPLGARQRRGVGVPAVAPAQLAGLGYLPENCNLAAAIHVAELYQKPIGAKLFETRKAAADGEPPPPWLIEQGLGRVEAWTGLNAPAIDHIVFGLRVDDKLPHLTIVVRTRDPYDPQVVAAKQGKIVPIEHLQRKLYQFNTPPLGSGMLWLADARTLILVWRIDALTDRDRQDLKDNPRKGADAPPPALRKVLSERLTSGTLIWWSAVDVDQPGLAAGLLPGVAKDKELVKLLKSVRSVTAGLRLQDDAAALASIECEDATSAKRLAELLPQQRLPGLDKPTVAGPAPDGSDAWVSLQMRGSPEAVVQTLRNLRLIQGPRK
jgi:hypothetical protein